MAYLANSVLENGGPLSDMIVFGIPSTENIQSNFGMTMEDLVDLTISAMGNQKLQLITTSTCSPNDNGPYKSICTFSHGALGICDNLTGFGGSVWPTAWHKMYVRIVCCIISSIPGTHIFSLNREFLSGNSFMLFMSVVNCTLSKRHRDYNTMAT